MKHIIIAGVFALSSTAALADAFEWQKRIGGPELDLYESTHGMSFAPVEKSGLVPSLTVWMETANVDSIADNDFRGTIIESGPSRISLYEIQRGSPEGIAYSDYHERYPADTDWEAVARNFRESRMNQDLASKAGSQQDAGS